MSSNGTVESSGAFTAEQKEFLAGFMAGVARRDFARFDSGQTDESIIAHPSRNGGPVPPHAEETVFGTPLSDLNKQERWKHEEHPLDGWDRLLAHAEADRLPDEENTYRLRNFGLFFVGPAQNSFMLRCRIPAGELTAPQLSGLADIADEFGNGRAAITTRSNIQIREIAPRNLVNVLTRLQSLGLTARGSGVDNVRNITASPTAGFDPQELIDTRPFAHALHHYILNHRELYGLPRKFNVAFEGGGSVDTVAETNDIGFMAVTIRSRPRPSSSSLEQAQSRTTDENENDRIGVSLKDGSPIMPEPGVYFRVELAGITGHRQLASDSGIIIKPSEAVAVAAAMIRVFIENGDRTDRKKARLKYLIDKWGIPRFLDETQRKLAFPLVKLPAEQSTRRPPSIRHGHVGVFRQKQSGRNYIGVAIPVGVMTTRQMRRLAQLASNYGSGQLRLTPWQNLLIPDVPDGFIETVKRQIVRIGFHFEATAVAGGLVACTGNTGCKWAATDTKGQALALTAHLDKRVALDQPINIHLTGCPHSCAQHYVGDIGLQGVKVSASGTTVEGYNVVVGGGCGAEAAIGRDVFKGIAFSQIPLLIERMLKTYLARRHSGESFAAFTRRHEIKELQEMFSA